MKKIVGLLLVSILTLTLLTACGGDSKSSTAAPQGGENTPSTGNTIVVTGGDITYNASVTSATATSVDGLYVTDSMYDVGIQRPGNVQRLASAFSRAGSGETITIGYIGTSITAGYGASSEANSYANLVTDWWKKTFPSATINVINISAPNMGSYIANSRIQSELIPSHPDVVIVETAMVDNTAVCEEAFECLVRSLANSTDSEAAVIPLITSGSGFTSNSSKQSAIAFQLDLPVISYTQVVKTNCENGTWKWADVSSDSVNPNDKGHAFIASLITNYYKRVVDGMASSSYTRYTVKDNTSTSCRYLGATFQGAAELKYTAENGQYSKVTLPDSDKSEIKYGIATTEADTITITAKGSNVGLVYWKVVDQGGGSFDIYLDDSETPLSTVYAGLSGETDGAMSSLAFLEIGKFTDGAEHTIRIQPHDPDTVATEGKCFWIAGLAVTK